MPKRTSKVFRTLQRAEAERWTVLDLDCTWLGELPRELIDVAHLEVLTLRHVGFSDLGDLMHLTKVKHLTILADSSIDASGLALLPGLCSLAIFATGIQNAFTLRHLSNLRHLQISDQHLDDVTFLHGLTNLSTLTLSNALLEGFEPFESLTQITSLHFSHIRRSAIDFSVLRNHQTLARIQVQDSSYKNLASLRHCKQLRELCLSSSEGMNLTGLEHIDSLTQLYLMGSSPGRDLNPLRGCTNLATLFLGFYGSVFPDICSLQHLSKLENLDLFPVNDLSPIRNLKNLRSLHLRHSKADNITHLSELVELCELDLLSTSIASLRPLKRLQNLTKLLIDDVRDRDYSPLRHLASLKDLHLSNVQGHDLSVFRSLPNLSDLSLGNVKDCDLSALKHLVAMKRLTISDVTSADLSPLENLVNLTSLSILGERHAFQNERIPTPSLPGRGSRLIDLTISHVQLCDLSALQHATDLQRLDIGSFDHTYNLDDISFMKDLRNLRYVNIQGTRVHDLSHLQHHSKLERINAKDCSATSLPRLKELVNLVELDLSHSELTNADTVADLVAIESLDLSGTKIRHLVPLHTLSALGYLNLAGTEISDICFLQDVHSLETIDISNTAVEDISTLGDLHELKHVKLSGAPISDLYPLTRLEHLTKIEKLNLSGTQIRALSPISHFRMLRELDISSTPVADISALPQLQRLEQLSLSHTQVSDISHLQHLIHLRKLNIACNAVQDISPLVHLHRLRDLDARRCQIDRFPLFLLDRLEHLVLSDNPIQDCPVEIINGSYRHDDCCLAAARAHFADLAHGEGADRELKLIVLGNGRVGKSSLLRRVIHNSFDAEEVTTHGIRFETWSFNVDGSDVRINVWDFGGQEIYHGTHSLFLRCRAIFLVVWDHVTENTLHHEEGGHLFDNLPLMHWIRQVTMWNPEASVLVVENKCDDGRSTSRNVDLGGQPATAFSARTGFNREVLLGYIRDACLRELARPYSIGIGRLAVKRELLRLRDEERQGILSPDDYRKICSAQAGTISSPDEYLKYLHDTGVCYYKQENFGGQIILDQRWALDAIYSIFHREKSYRQLLRRGGRFRRSDLSDLVWGDSYSEAEQEVFIQFMESCEICFLLYDSSDECEYLAPELLPHRAQVAREIERRWRHMVEQPGMWFRYEHQFLHPRVMQRFMISVGRRFRDCALYWRNGVIIETVRPPAVAEIRYTRTVSGPSLHGQIEIEARGDGRREALSILREEFDRLYENLDGVFRTVSDNAVDWIDVDKLEDGVLVGRVVATTRRVLESAPFRFLVESGFSGDPKQGLDRLTPTARRTIDDDSNAVSIQTRDQDLYGLFVDLFDVSGLYRFVALGPDGRCIVHDLPGSPCSLADMAFAAVAALRRGGYLDSRFFERLCGAFPQRVDDINRVASTWRTSEG